MQGDSGAWCLVPGLEVMGTEGSLQAAVFLKVRSEL